MKYLSPELNANKLFLPLATLLKSPSSSQKLTETIEKFLFRASCALQGLSDIEQSLNISVKCAEEYRDQIKFHDSNKKVLIASNILFTAYSNIPSILSNIVIMQNKLLNLIAQIFDYNLKGIPSSFNNAYKNRFHDFPNKTIINLFTLYYEGGGKYIRDLRDINEHFDELLNETYYLQLRKQGKILMYFPDNPEIKSPKKFTYEKQMNAFDVLFDSLKILSNVIEDICSLKKVPPSDFKYNITIDSKIKPSLVPEYTVGLMINSRKKEGDGLFIETLELRKIIDSTGVHRLEAFKLEMDRNRK